MMRKFIHALRDCERGASLIEMALAAPVLAALLIGMTDLSRAYAMKLQLEQAAQRSIEKVEQQKSVATDYSTTLSAEATSAATAEGYATSTNAVDAWLECSSDGVSWTRQASFTDASGCAATDYVARYVTVTVSAKYTPMFGVGYFPSHNTDGTVTLSGQAGVRIQ